VTRLDELVGKVTASPVAARDTDGGTMSPDPDVSPLPATDGLVALVTAVLSNPQRPDPSRLPGAGADGAPAGGDGTPPPSDQATAVAPGASGLGTSAAHLFIRTVRGADPAVAAPLAKAQFTGRPTGLGTSTWWLPADQADQAEPDADQPASDPPIPPLFCPGPVRDDPALGEEVNERLVDWAEEVGIYEGRLDKLRSYNFGRLIMLTHPASSDPDRLLAATKCVVAEWATDDYVVDEVDLGADPRVVGERLALLTAVVDPRHLPARYLPQLDAYRREEALATAFRSAMEHLARYASTTQIGRFQHQMAVLFVAWTQEADWHRSGRTPPVWEYLVQRQLNSYLPPMILIDSVAGYELPASEFYDPRVRRAFTTAGFANVLLNDLHSAAFESDTDFNLPRVISVEEKCSHEEAIRRTVEIHNELMETFVAEALALSVTGSPMLQRFFVDTWAWLGGSREWHATSGRYQADGGR
jgi:2-methylisoborneol synthase